MLFFNITKFYIKCRNYDLSLRYCIVFITLFRLPGFSSSPDPEIIALALSTYRKFKSWSISANSSLEQVVLL